MKKKRGKAPSLISSSSGKPTKTIAKRKRTCVRCGYSILRGEVCFEVPRTSGGFSNKRSFCPSCFKETLEQTKSDILKIEQEL